MLDRVAAHFDDLRQRFPAASTSALIKGQYSLETMNALAAAPMPQGFRSAYTEIGGVKFLIWPTDEEQDSFSIFATFYNTPIGTLRLSTNPNGILEIDGFKVNLGQVAQFIRAHFKETPAPTGLPPPRRVLLYGFSQSFGHHMWNEVSGLTSAIATGLFDALDGILIGPYDYFNLEQPLRATGKQVWKTTTLNVQLPEKLIVYHNTVFTDAARRLIIQNAAQQAAAAQPIQGPSICFQLRRHRRPWVNEEKGLISLITECRKLWPSVHIFIDGFGTSRGAIPVFAEEIAAEQACAQRLCAALPADSQPHVTVGMDINEKINRLKQVDLFIGPIGSGGVFSSWLLRKPTITYGPTGYHGLVTHQEHTIPEGGPLAQLLPAAQTSDHADSRGAFDVQPHDIMAMIRQGMERPGHG